MKNDVRKKSSWEHFDFMNLWSTLGVKNKPETNKQNILRSVSFTKASDAFLWCILHRLKTSTLLKWNKNKRFLSSSGNFLPMDFE